jgi:SPP1 gp7 family putative phage head morphogenesis protein
MPPLVIDLMQNWRADLLRGDEAMQQEMARRWLGLEQALQAQVDALALELQGGGRVTLGQLGRSRRYQQLMRQVDDELARYGRFAEDRIAARQRALLSAAITHSQAAVAAVATDAEILLQFNRLPVAAVENMIGLTGAGTPVGDILADASQVGPEALRQVLVDGIALGRNPLETARRALREGLARSFTRMATIARTETLRVYRETTQESYRRSHVVAGYRRLAAKDERTCLGCLMADGQFHTLDEPFDAHPNDRCTLVPVLNRGAPVDYETGPEWFVRQPESVQRRMLGTGRWELFQRGDLSLGDLVTRRRDDTWGGALVPTSVGRLAALGRRP